MLLVAGGACRAEIRERTGAHRHLIHRLDTTRDDDIVDAACDEAVGEGERLLRRSTLRVNGRAGHPMIETRGEPGIPGYVAALLTDLAHAAAGDLPDDRGVDARAFDQSREYVAEQIRR